MDQEIPLSNVNSSARSLQTLAQDFLLRLKTEQSVDKHLEELSQLDPVELSSGLSSDEQRMPFWINLYNGYNLYLMRGKPEVNDHTKSRMKHFLRRQIVVAGRSLSLMDIENGILRRSKVWWGLGYIPRLFASSYERSMRVDKLDPRVHFALNCGAMSCPPIRFYSPEQIDAELQLATKAYLQTEVRAGKDKEENTLYVSSLFRAYRADFGSEGGILAFIRNYKEIPERKWKLKFIAWDSTTDLDDFAAL